MHGCFRGNGARDGGLLFLTRRQFLTPTLTRELTSSTLVSRFTSNTQSVMEELSRGTRTARPAQKGGCGVCEYVRRASRLLQYG